MPFVSDALLGLIPFGAFILVVIFLFRMRPRRFYLVRHGQTILNANHIRQGADGGLSELGRQQADSAGRFLAQFPITCIIASPFPRAKETALIINSHLHVPVSYSELLVERKNPSAIIGKPSADPAVMHIVDQMDRAYHADDFRIADEENFTDLRDRAKKALALLSRQGARETCVVTHSIFLKMLIAFLLYRKRLTANEYVKLSFFNASDNASITIAEYDPWRCWNETRGWRVIAYNETP